MQTLNDADFLIAHLSDLHVRPSGELYQGVADSNQMLADTIRQLNRLDRPADLVLISGDLVDEGQATEYAMLRELLAQLSAPCFVIPGNHDDRDAFRAAFSDHQYLPATGAMHYCIDDYPVRLVALDSTVPGKHHGLLDDAGLAWLAATLTAAAHKPTIVMLHHPPFHSGIPYMDKYRLFESERLAAVLVQHSNIEVVLCGHLHRSMMRRWAGTMVCSCPSTTTEIALQLDPAARSQSFVGSRACLLHHWRGAHGLLTHQLNIGEFAGPFPFA